MRAYAITTNSNQSISKASQKQKNTTRATETLVPVQSASLSTLYSLHPALWRVSPTTASPSPSPTPTPTRRWTTALMDGWTGKPTQPPSPRRTSASLWRTPTKRFWTRTWRSLRHKQRPSNSTRTSLICAPCSAPARPRPRNPRRFPSMSPMRGQMPRHSDASKAQVSWNHSAQAVADAEPGAMVSVLSATLRQRPMVSASLTTKR